MAKKNYVKYLPKVGSTVAVAMAMTVALSTQASATELNEGDIHLNDDKQLNDSGSVLTLDLNGSQPVEHNESIEQKNGETADKNQAAVDKNEQTLQKNEEALEQNKDVPDGKLPEMPDVPDAPEVPAMPDDPEAPVAPEVPEQDLPEIPEIPEVTEEIVRGVIQKLNMKVKTQLVVDLVMGRYSEIEK